MDNKNLSKIEKGQSVFPRSDTQVYEAIRTALAAARTKVVVAVNATMVGVYWEIGRQIAEAVGDRAEYDKGLIKYLSERLTKEFGKGFDESTLRKMRKFYLTFPIRDTVCPELTWSHYRLLIRVEEENRREFYTEAGKAIGFALEQTLRDAALTCSALRILKRLEHTNVSVLMVIGRFVSLNDKSTRFSMNA
ncbi:MAG: DUF1016 N-terminal domain-containing protein [Planctomycetaceae bacterium]|jgi:hypothetical protein|nr:DUF1016 N-terminal domain-containing protein [Planctomycetaceae bacterium]